MYNYLKICNENLKNSTKSLENRVSCICIHVNRKMSLNFEFQPRQWFPRYLFSNRLKWYSRHDIKPHVLRTVLCPLLLLCRETRPPFHAYVIDIISCNATRRNFGNRVHCICFRKCTEMHRLVRIPAGCLL